MFSLRNFIKKGLIDAVGNMPAYWIINNAAGWYKNGVLLEEDLAEIDSAIKNREAEVKAEMDSAMKETAV